MPGCGVTVKHFACNNQETNRYYMSSELSERTLRDMYLKAFEIIVKEAEPKALMTAYNYLIMPGNRKNKRKLYKEYKAGLVSRADLQRAAKNVLNIIMEEN